MEDYFVSKVFEISYAHRLLNYNGKCENLHGHNGKIEIIVSSKKLDNEDMVMDFVKLKRIVGKWLDENLDHCIILHKKDPLVKILKKHNQKVFVLNFNPTAEVISKLIFDEVKKLGLNPRQVKFWETETSMAAVMEE
ncbi:MAG: 6-carboxytetrahydropterin synthase [Elusimicrobiota bacterium]